MEREPLSLTISHELKVGTGVNVVGVAFVQAFLAWWVEMDRGCDWRGRWATILGRSENVECEPIMHGDGISVAAMSH